MAEWLWIRGAKFVNEDQEPLANFIREYTKQQYHYRTDGQLDEGKLQDASNSVARNFFNDVLGHRADNPGVFGVRDIRTIGEADAASHDWLEIIKGHYLMQAFVDKATDFSAVQLACTAELAHPRLHSWFASGDLRQRITATGLQDDSEILWLDRAAGINIDIRRIEIGYRQSQRLRLLSDALAQILDPTSTGKTKPSRSDEEADAWPLLGENLSGEALAQWLAGRIDEVERAIGRLPSIAVFVDGDDKIDPLLAFLEPLMTERNIPVMGYKGGLVVGDAREMRIFDVEHIKGMEFEAVFFVGIGRLAERIPDLFLRFLYVGVARAATYLGLACEAALPARLESVRSHFSTGDWSAS